MLCKLFRSWVPSVCVILFVFIFITRCLKLGILEAGYETGICYGWLIYWGALCRENWQETKKSSIKKGKEPCGLMYNWGLAQFMACRGAGGGRVVKEQVTSRYCSETVWPWAVRISAMRVALSILHGLGVACRGCGLLRVGTSWERQACLLCKTVLQRRWVAGCESLATDREWMLQSC